MVVLKVRGIGNPTNNNSHTMFNRPKSAPLPRKQYDRTAQRRSAVADYNAQSTAATDTYVFVKGMSIKRAKSSVKSVKHASKYQFIKKKPLFTDRYTKVQLPGRDNE